MKKSVTSPQSVSDVQNKILYEVPTNFVPLPSAGQLYGSDTNLHATEDIEIRAMTARDEDILTSQSLIKKGVAIERLLQNVIIDKSININDMIRGDRDALLVALRISGYGSEYETKITCPACGAQSNYTFSLSNLPIQRLKINPVEEYTNAFEFKLPVTKKMVLWKFITAGDEKEIAAIQKRRKTSLKAQSDNFITEKLLHSIISIDGVTDKMAISNFIKNMPAKDSMELRIYMDENEPKIVMEDIFSCIECGEDSEVTVPMSVQFFWPNVKS